jgi:hypothetical protein
MMSDESGVGYGDDFTRERRVRGDQVAQTMHGHAFIVHQLHHSERNLRKGRHPEMCPWDPFDLAAVVVLLHSSNASRIAVALGATNPSKARFD